MLDVAREIMLADIDHREAFTNPEIAAQTFVERIGKRDREYCEAIFLDTKHRLISIETISIGSIDHTFMAPREVYRDALLLNASALIISHNHPSGDPEPSRDDELVSKRLLEAGGLIGVELLDHIVVGGERWVSLARRGVI